jgi:hypothetical protein
MALVVPPQFAVVQAAPRRFGRGPRMFRVQLPSVGVTIIAIKTQTVAVMWSLFAEFRKLIRSPHP